MRRRKAKPNPDWVDQMLARNWEAISEAPDAGPLPIETDGVMEELGCGAYGCVLPTHTPGTVLKITTDGSEAFFAQGAMELARGDGTWPPGIVEYYSALALPEEFADRPVFLVWREEAYNVGALRSVAATSLTDPVAAAQAEGRQVAYDEIAGERARDSFVSLLYGFMRHAVNLSDYMRVERRDRDSFLLGLASALEDAQRGAFLRERPPMRRSVTVGHLAWELHQLYQVSEKMTRLPLGSSVGTALHYYLQKGMVLADVHAGNVGEVGDGWDEARGDYADPDDWDFAITDPGNMVVISPEWLGLDVPMVPELAPQTRREPTRRHA